MIKLTGRLALVFVVAFGIAMSVFTVVNASVDKAVSGSMTLQEPHLPHSPHEYIPEERLANAGRSHVSYVF